eukprot:TRINITY_DN4269_c0_g1_i2.p1 TRINITY_DN4269_c0_g1~~TRINITY_DN4269_c0_g1_i2.p1  ORF type:complete len:269 (+),score=40.42 TRINITY_DN4269_c0_g1_i2:541-1347(+)
MVQVNLFEKSVTYYKNHNCPINLTLLFIWRETKNQQQQPMSSQFIVDENYEQDINDLIKISLSLVNTVHESINREDNNLLAYQSTTQIDQEIESTLRERDSTASALNDIRIRLRKEKLKDDIQFLSIILEEKKRKAQEIRERCEKKREYEASVQSDYTRQDYNNVVEEGRKMDSYLSFYRNLLGVSMAFSGKTTLITFHNLDDRDPERTFSISLRYSQRYSFHDPTCSIDMRPLKGHKSLPQSLCYIRNQFLNIVAEEKSATYDFFST